MLDKQQVVLPEVAQAESYDQNNSKPGWFRRVFGKRITNVLAGTFLATGLTLASGCSFDTSGRAPYPTDAGPDTTVPVDGGSDAGDAGDAAPVQENCSVAGDEDNNGLPDCQDPVCVGQVGPGPVLGTCQATETNCTDGYNNDGVNGIDCDDPSCFPSGQCAEVCGDGLDNDGDGKIDCEDEHCFGEVGCEVEICDNPGDEDQNGVEGCQDSACDGQQGPDGTCEFGTELTCDDGVDNDANGLTDCADSTCFGPLCNELGDLCHDDEDNNLDGLVDCEEPLCDLSDNADEICVVGIGHELNCTDGVDNDGDGDTDCADAACQVTAACGYTPEICDDGIDNNADNGGVNDRVDCEEAACALDPACVTAPNCDPLPEGASCPTGLQPPNHVGACAQAHGDLPRGCQPL